MKNKSVLTGGKRPPQGEHGFLNLWGVVQSVAGLLLLGIPAGGGLRAHLVLAACWALFACMLLAAVRALLFNRGFADTVLGLALMLLYGFYSWAASSSDLYVIDSYRPVLCIALLFCGIARILAFAQIMDRVRLPLLVVSGLAESAAAVLLLLGIPSYATLFLYLYTGLLFLLSGFGALFEAARVREPRRIDVH